VEARARNKATQADTPFVPSDPSVLQAIADSERSAAVQAQKMRNQQPGLDVLDDRPKQRAVVTRPSAAKVFPIGSNPDIASPQESVPAPTVAPPIPKGNTGVDLERTHCQHCGWDLSRADDTEITAEDKRVFVAALQGGKRFVKGYELYDGAIRVTFRSMQSEEYKLMLHQLMLDAKQGKITNQPEIYQRAQEYQLVVCLESMQSAEDAVQLIELSQYDLPEVDEEDNETTGLPLVVEHVYQKAIRSESLRRVLLATYVEFDNLNAKLEAAARQPGFMKATEKPR